MSATSRFPVTKRRLYANLQEQKAFVRETLDRQVTQEVRVFHADAAARSRTATSANFLDRFRAASKY